jgi:hypothetical protein
MRHEGEKIGTADFHRGYGFLRIIRAYPRFLSVAETMINARQCGNSLLPLSPAANGLLAAALFGALAVVSPCCDSD